MCVCVCVRVCVCACACIWEPHTPNAGGNMLFPVFWMTNVTKRIKRQKMRQKNLFFGLHPNVVCRFYYQKKKHFHGKNMFSSTRWFKKVFFLGIIYLLWNNQLKRLPIYFTCKSCKPSNTQFVAFFLIFLPIFTFFWAINVKKHISTNIWTTQHPKTGENIQQMYSFH